jgi:IstB-like ATP binding protein
MTAALLDRLVHRSTILRLEGESYRFRQSMQRQEQAQPRVGYDVLRRQSSLLRCYSWEVHVGAFVAGIFDDDVALDLRASAEAAINEGLNMGEVTAQVLAEYGDYLDDSDDGPAKGSPCLHRLQGSSRPLAPGVWRQIDL